ncbi:DUF2177 family protein [Litorimonas haliclonae]|uniref:DUF2177 family protein n=1 Tax=Litorimonas haliclonae TaxID=2081977 RepID=UPI0039F0AC1E
MTTYLIAYFSTLIAFFALDMLWLGLIARKFYANQLGSLMADSPNWLVAVVFYAMYIVGIVFFAIRPAIEAEQVLKATLYGALFGFFCYATYDLTNLATLRDWPTKMVVVDIIWGIILTGSCATVGAWATLKFAA